MTPLERVIALQAREEEARLSHMNNCDLCGEKEAEWVWRERYAALKVRARYGV